MPISRAVSMTSRPWGPIRFPRGSGAGRKLSAPARRRRPQVRGRGRAESCGPRRWVAEEVHRAWARQGHPPRPASTNRDGDLPSRRGSAGPTARSRLPGGWPAVGGFRTAPSENEHPRTPPHRQQHPVSGGPRRQPAGGPAATPRTSDVIDSPDHQVCRNPVHGPRDGPGPDRRKRAAGAPVPPARARCVCAPRPAHFLWPAARGPRAIGLTLSLLVSGGRPHNP